MTLMEMLQQAAANKQKNDADSDDNDKAVLAQATDRIKMANPDVQGPRLPLSGTPEEAKQSDNVTSAMMGSMAPVNKLAGLSKLTGIMGKAEPTAIEAGQAALAAAPEVKATMPVVEGITRTGPNVAAMPTQAANTQMMLAERNAQQLKNVKLARLKAMMK